VNTARRVLATRDLGTESDLVLLAQRARMANLAGQRDAVGRDLSAALALVPAENPQAAMVFLDLLAKALPDAQARLEFLRGAQAPAGMGKWLELAKFLAMMGNPAMRSEAAAGLTVLAGEPDNLAVAFMAARTAALEAYTAGRYEDAAALFRRSVEINPRDGEMNNNLAYTLARHLNRAADALPHAEAAARLMPQSGSVLDTLGMTYMMNGRLAEADTTLRRALSLAATPTERIPILLHQAELAARRSDRFEAARGLERAEEAMRREPQARERYQPEYEAVKRVIDSL
jgi:tetratricopeptide (TPR) repeat protein